MNVFTVKQAAIAANSNPALSLEEKRQAWRNVLGACFMERRAGYVSYCRDVRLGETEWDAKAQIQTITKKIIAQRAA